MTKPRPNGTTRIVETRCRRHGVNPKLVVTLLPDGTLKVRERGRRVSVVLDVATLYVRAVIASVKIRPPRRRRQNLF